MESVLLFSISEVVDDEMFRPFVVVVSISYSNLLYKTFQTSVDAKMQVLQ